MNAEEALRMHPIERTSEPVTALRIAAFVEATGIRFSTGIPGTFPTIFREPEFDWLKKLKVNMHQLLHTEQEYEYVSPIEIGDRVRTSTRVADYRERRGLLFVKLESEMFAGERLAIRSFSCFVIRQDSKGGAH